MKLRDHFRLHQKPSTRFPVMPSQVRSNHGDRYMCAAAMAGSPPRMKERSLSEMLFIDGSLSDKPLRGHRGCPPNNALVMINAVVASHPLLKNE
jgi:hypothetical protein